MAVRTKEDLAYVEIYRPVESGLESFIAGVRREAEPIFGYEVPAFSETPKIEGEGEAAEPVMEIEPVQEPRLDVYQNGNVRLPMVDLRAVPQARVKFSNAVRRLLNNPGEGVADPRGQQPVTTEQQEKKNKTSPVGQSSLGDLFEKIGMKYGVEDQQHLDLALNWFDEPIDPFLSHLGVELVLLPDPSSDVTLMLKEQVEACMRGFGRKSSEIVNPYTPLGLTVPILRRPKNSSPNQIGDLHDIIKSRLKVPLRVVLGGFKDRVNGSSWQPEKKKSKDTSD